MEGVGETYMEMKKRAVKYYNDNQVPQHLENLLNEMFIENPDDIFGYLSEYFSKLSKPARISGVVCQPGINMRGFENMRVDVSCCVNGVDKQVLSMCSLCDNGPQKEEVTARMKSASEKATSKATKKKMKDMNSIDNMSRESIVDKPKKLMSFARLCEVFEQEFVPVLTGSETLDQQHIDGCLNTLIDDIAARNHPPVCEVPSLVLSEENEHPPVEEDGDAVPPNNDASVTVQEPLPQTGDESKPPSFERSELYVPSMFASLLVACARASVTGRSLCSSLLPEGSGGSVGSFPTPALSVLTCDPASPGKLMMVKDLMVCPKPTVPRMDGITLLLKLSAALPHALHTKFGGSGLVRNTEGRYTPSCDKIDQIFELLVDAASSIGSTFDETFDIIMDIDAGQLYDEEKSKYEVALGGSAKSTDALVEMYKDWLEHHPIVAIVDPLTGKDEEGMQALFADISSKCSIYTSNTNKDDVTKTLSRPLVNGVVLHPERTVSNVTDLIAYASNIRSLSANLILNDDWSSLLDNVAVVDIAVALETRYVAIGPSNAYKSLTRLLQLCKEMKGEGEVEPVVEMSAQPVVEQHVEEENGSVDR